MRVEVTRLTLARAPVAVFVIQGGRKNVFRPTAAKARPTEFVFCSAILMAGPVKKRLLAARARKTQSASDGFPKGRTTLAPLGCNPQMPANPRKGTRLGENKKIFRSGGLCRSQNHRASNLHPLGRQRFSPRPPLGSNPPRRPASRQGRIGAYRTGLRAILPPSPDMGA